MTDDEERRADDADDEDRAHNIHDEDQDDHRSYQLGGVGRSGGYVALQHLRISYTQL